jgi:protocatechuate 3,4-dioxygenase beta subunit
MISLLTAVAAAATLSGTVRSADGSPIAGATVQLWDSSLSGVDTTSDADGRFTFTDVAPAPTGRGPRRPGATTTSRASSPTPSPSVSPTASSSAAIRAASTSRSPKAPP